MASRRKAHIGMKWFRSNIKHGSRAALVALAVQFALSFGHFHAVAVQAPAIEWGPATADISFANGLRATDPANRSAQQPPASHHDSDQDQSDTCAICAVIALAYAMLSATPPLLLPPHAVDFSYRTTDAGLVDVHAVRVAFQPRAPPLS